MRSEGWEGGSGPLPVAVAPDQPVLEDGRSIGSGVLRLVPSLKGVRQEDVAVVMAGAAAV